MEDFKGKKLLILGGGDKWDQTTEVDLVRYAHEMGLYAIVTDSQADWNKVPAKFEADEAWDISWSDTETLARLCREKGIDGVIAGFSERKVMCAGRLAHELGMPFYTDGADLETIFNKSLFKEACRNAGVDVPRSFDVDGDIIFPVVVKPVDNAGGRGMSICRNREELSEGIAKAMQFSDASTPEIEEFVEGLEVFVYYIVRNGVPTFSMASEIATMRDSERGMPYHVANRFPSHQIERIRRECDEAFVRLIRSLGIQNGYIGLQCFVTDDRVMVHDPTFRIDGANDHEVAKMITGVSDVEFYIAHALTGTFGTQEDAGKLHYRSDWPIFIQVGSILGPGIIGEFSGLDDVANIDGVYEVEQVRRVGDKMKLATSTLSQIGAQIKLQAPDSQTLRVRLQEVFDAISVKDVNGADMVVPLNLDELAFGKTQDK